jgi:hypothetical protein
MKHAGFLLIALSVFVQSVPSMAQVAVLPVVTVACRPNGGLTAPNNFAVYSMSTSDMSVIPPGDLTTRCASVIGELMAKGYRASSIIPDSSSGVIYTFTKRSINW